MKQFVCTVIGAVGSGIAALFGGWDTGLVSLLIFMGLDYVSGLVVAGVFHKSKKTNTGSLESKTCWKGLCRKCMTLVFVLVSYRLDLIIGTNYIRDCGDHCIHCKRTDITCRERWSYGCTTPSGYY